ncbi:MAG: DUF4386 domain-containing protein [Nocardioides sp.]
MSEAMRRTEAATLDDRALRSAALIGGIALLVLAAIAGIVNVGVIERLVTDGDDARTVRDLANSLGLVRLGIAGLAVVAILDLVVAWAWWIFFGPAGPWISALAACCRAAYAVVFAIAIAALGQTARVLSGATGADVTDVVRRDAMAGVDRFESVWSAGLGLFGVHLVLIGWLSFRSGYVPRWIGVLVAIAGAGYLIDAVGGRFAGYSIEIGSVAFVGEVVLLAWLLIRGRTLVR